MLQNDYIMRMILDMATMIRRIWGLPDNVKRGHSDDLEDAVADVVNIDPKVFFSLDPESAVKMMEMGEVDSTSANYVVHGILLSAKMREAQGDIGIARLRREQAIAIAKRYGVEIASLDDEEAIVSVFDHAEEDYSDSKKAAAPEREEEPAPSMMEKQSELRSAYEAAGRSFDSLKIEGL